METYIFIDVSKKQEFIYKNNRLKENILNSVIIKAITEGVEKNIELGNVVKVNLRDELNKPEYFSPENVYSGGGNSIIKFKDRETAKTFIRNYSKEVLKHYPELELYISMHEKTKNDDEESIRKQLHRKSDEQKDLRKSRFRRWSYGIEKIDESGKPVRIIENKGSSDASVNLAKEVLGQKLKSGLGKNENIEITYEMKDYKEDDSKRSYIGVIAIDGNKMGDLVSKIKEFEKLSQFSKEIDELYVKSVAQAVKEIAEEYKSIDRNQKMLITPIVLAGDDICIATQSESAIELAAKILEKIEVNSSKLKNEYVSEREDIIILPQLMKDIKVDKLTACGGVSIVKAGYPFFESIKDAEHMCSKAKEYIHKEACEGESGANASYLDWNIIKGANDYGYDYENNVGDGNLKSRFHIKPLKISQEKAEQNGIYGYTKFIGVVKKIKEGLASNQKERKISKSSIQNISQLIYSGKSLYDLEFEIKKVKDYENIGNIIKEVYEDKGIKYGVKTVKKDGIEENTYILNDIIEVLDFIGKKVD